VYSLVGTSLATQESVPAAFAVLAAAPDDPWLACRIGASLGGDCDTIAAIAGAIGGACHGVDAFPASARGTVAQVNHLRMDEIARELLVLRERAPRRPALRRPGMQRPGWPRPRLHGPEPGRPDP
jgi:ADP-ribosylglycohydrolase